MKHDLGLVRQLPSASPVIAASDGDGSIFRLSIARRVFLVGAIPIFLAVLLGIASIVLLDRADSARRGALTVSAVFRNVVSAISARDDFVNSIPADRATHIGAFMASIGAATTGLSEIAEEVTDPDNADAVLATIGSLERFKGAMGELEIAVDKNDELLASMDARLDRLISLTDEARGRQHESNADVVSTLRDRDVTLRNALELTSATTRMRRVVVEAWTDRLADRSSQSDDPFSDARLANAADSFRTAFDTLGDAGAITEFNEALQIFMAGGAPDALLRLLDRRLKIDGTAARASHEQVSELLTYTVNAQETEQATQNIAVETLKLGERTREAVRSRDIVAISAIIGESRKLGETIASLPISPLIQTEMLTALDLWRNGLAETRSGLATQNAILRRMAVASSGMVFEVSNLNATLSKNADATGTAARRILLFSAGFGLFVAVFFGLNVARSITRPLKGLERGMLQRAENPTLGLLEESQRRDEIGHMTRATNHFLAELGKRERALRRAKDDTEDALDQLKRTQRELIQSEKLASLGQLVAGVAHEINTPLGVALTTSTVMRDETAKFKTATSEGKVTRQAFDDFIERTGEGARLMTANLDRAADLVASFKQVAADQASGERRAFKMDSFVADLFTSLGPMQRRAGHPVKIDCEDGIEMLSYPGALSQILTNLLTNAYTHAFEAGSTGTVNVTIRKSGANRVRIEFADDGRGISPENRPRIFDPFFTTGRSSGSTGLGLHIVYNLVTATLGGTIEAESEIGKGTTFVIDIPRERQETAPAPAGETADAS